MLQGLDGIHLKIQSELLVEFTKPFSIIFPVLAHRGVPNDCRLTNGTLIYRKGGS